MQINLVGGQDSVSENGEAAVTALQVSLQKTGSVTIPPSIQAELGLGTGDLLNLLKIGDCLLLTPRPLQVPQLADQITALRENSQLELADLLTGLVTERQLIDAENATDA